MDAWWAIRSDDPSAVMKRLASGDTRRGTLGKARSLAARDRSVMFVSDPIEGWVLVVAPGLALADRGVAWLREHLDWASTNLGEVQAFVADPAAGAYGWLRSVDGELGRSVVYDGHAYVLTNGKRSAKEPNFPQLLATPSRADVLAVAAAWSLDPTQVDASVKGTFATLDFTASAAVAVVDVLDPPGADERDHSFVTRVVAAYGAGHWRGKRFRGEKATTKHASGARWAWPAVWGEPTDVRGNSVWMLDDATIVLQLASGMASTPNTVSEWLAVARRSAKPGWVVLAGCERPHDGGKAIEILEACAAEPRAVRVTSYLFHPPSLGVMAITCPDMIPPSRGSEMLATFASLRLP